MHQHQHGRSSRKARCAPSLPRGLAAPGSLLRPLKMHACGMGLHWGGLCGSSPDVPGREEARPPGREAPRGVAPPRMSRSARRGEKVDRKGDGESSRARGGASALARASTVSPARCGASSRAGGPADSVRRRRWTATAARTTTVAGGHCQRMLAGGREISSRPTGTSLTAYRLAPLSHCRPAGGPEGDVAARAGPRLALHGPSVRWVIPQWRLVIFIRPRRRLRDGLRGVAGRGGPRRRILPQPRNARLFTGPRRVWGGGAKHAGTRSQLSTSNSLSRHSSTTPRQPRQPRAEPRYAFVMYFAARRNNQI